MGIDNSIWIYLLSGRMQMKQTKIIYMLSLGMRMKINIYCEDEDEIIKHASALPFSHT